MTDKHFKGDRLSPGISAEQFGSNLNFFVAPGGVTKDSIRNAWVNKKKLFFYGLH